MKTAKLPNGEILEFPDMTPDHAMDATAREYIRSHLKKTQVEREENQRGDDNNRFERGLQHRDSIYERESTERRGYRFEDNARADQQHSHKMAASLLSHKIHGDGVSALGQIGEHMKTLAGFAQSLQENSVAITDLSKAVDLLNKTVEVSVSEVIRILSAPKNLVFDNRGRPTGIKPEV